MMNQKIFKNRKQAGELLAERLTDIKNPVVLAIPRGGIETAAPVADKLGVEIHPFIAKKIPHPQNEEFAIGAISEEGEMYIPEGNHFSIQIFEPILEKLNEEIKRRVEVYRKGKPLPDMQGRTVIIIDDGIATGATLIPAIRLCKRKGAEKVIVACPVSGKQMAPALAEADEVIVLEKLDPYFGVGQAYRDFTQLTDDDVLQLLKSNHIET